MGCIDFMGVVYIIAPLALCDANFAISIIAGTGHGTHMNGGALYDWKPTNRLLFD
jgi:hypothetical protein